uniref:Large ribosomal subunit protein uL4m n=1 Tax=Vannella robusta TaxID=1487602 RepID=A0A7S4ISN3_9EUKA|mmetsp:Transcript_7981/g.9905  ORF Transcript_7981/g.9905 Transcript_7981/m.9905 type:complete len:314 (+) Transcript_7981:3-944(+)
MLRRFGPSISLILNSGSGDRARMGIQIAQRWNVQSQRNPDEVPIAKEVPHEDFTRIRDVVVEYVAPNEVPARSEEEAFILKEYPHGYFEAPVVNWNRKLRGTCTLPSSIFGEVLRTDIIHRCLRHRVLKRASQDGIKPTKTVSTISGSGRKPHPQKKTGRARQGKVRSNIKRGGEKAHGRVARDISIDMPAKVLRLGMRSALSAKYALGQIVIIDNIDVPSAKTKDFASLVRENRWGDRVMFLDTSISKELRMASHSVPATYVSTVSRANIWDILRRKLIVMTPACMDELVRLYHPLEDVRKEQKRKKKEETQ